MPIIVTFDLTKGASPLLVIDLAPPAAVGDWSTRFTVAYRFGASASGALVRRYGASGYQAGQSGVMVLDSGEGRYGVAPPTPRETSGWDPGPYAVQFERTDSGYESILTQGYLLLGQNVQR